MWTVRAAWNAAKERKPVTRVECKIRGVFSDGSSPCRSAPNCTMTQQDFADAKAVTTVTNQDRQSGRDHPFWRSVSISAHGLCDALRTLGGVDTRLAAGKALHSYSSNQRTA
jgi:hypothetical protein